LVFGSLNPNPREVAGAVARYNVPAT
jgi:hypothetical protein